MQQIAGCFDFGGFCLQYFIDELEVDIEHAGARLLFDDKKRCSFNAMFTGDAHALAVLITFVGNDNPIDQVEIPVPFQTHRNICTFATWLTVRQYFLDESDAHGVSD